MKAGDRVVTPRGIGLVRSVTRDRTEWVAGRPLPPTNTVVVLLERGGHYIGRPFRDVTPIEEVQTRD